MLNMNIMITIEATKIHFSRQRLSASGISSIIIEQAVSLAAEGHISVDEAALLPTGCMLVVGC